MVINAHPDTVSDVCRILTPFRMIFAWLTVRCLRKLRR